MKKKEGFVSLEVVLFSGFIITLLVVIIGLFAYIYPTFTIQRDVDVLARQAQRNGGLTSDDVSNFKAKMNSYKFVSKSSLDVDISANTNSNNGSAMNVNGSNYITRESGEVINIEVKVPSDSSIIKRFSKKTGDYYVFKASVVSEKIEDYNSY